MRVFSDRVVGGDRVRIEASDMGTMTTIKSVGPAIERIEERRKRWRAVEQICRPQISLLRSGDDVIRMEWLAIGGKDD